MTHHMIYSTWQYHDVAVAYTCEYFVFFSLFFCLSLAPTFVWPLDCNMNKYSLQHQNLSRPFKVVIDSKMNRYSFLTKGLTIQYNSTMYWEIKQFILHIRVDKFNRKYWWMFMCIPEISFQAWVYLDHHLVQMNYVEHEWLTWVWRELVTELSFLPVAVTIDSSPPVSLPTFPEIRYIQLTNNLSRQMNLKTLKPWNIELEKMGAHALKVIL